MQIAEITSVVTFFPFDNFARVGAETTSNKSVFFIPMAEDKEFAKGYLEFVDNVVCPSFDFAVKNGVIWRNPCTGVFAEISRDFCKLAEKRHSLTLQEQNAFIDYIANSPVYSHWLPMFTVFLGTGGKRRRLKKYKFEQFMQFGVCCTVEPFLISGSPL